MRTSKQHRYPQICSNGDGWRLRSCWFTLSPVEQSYSVEKAAVGFASLKHFTELFRREKEIERGHKGLIF
jgi:hypothetical protein